VTALLVAQLAEHSQKLTALLQSFLPAPALCATNFRQSGSMLAHHRQPISARTLSAMYELLEFGGKIFAFVAEFEAEFVLFFGVEGIVLCPLCL